MRDAAKLVIAVAASQMAGVIGAVFTSSSVRTWYVDLSKPSFTPPGWIFGPVWTTLYTLMGIAAWLVWRAGLPRLAARLALGLFVGQFALNAFWSLIFFGLRQPLYAFVEIIFLWAAIVATTVLFFRISTLAGLLMIPYILWVSFAAVLNLAIARLNP